MLGLDILVSQAKEKPLPVIIALIALLAIGGLGGGIWIQTLQTSLAQRDALEKQHLENLETENAIEKENLRAQLDRLSSREDDYKTGYTTVARDLDDAYTSLDDAARGKPLSETALRDLAYRLAFDKRSLEDLQLRIDKASERADNSFERPTSSPLPTRAPFASVTVMGAVLLLVAGIAFALRRWQQSRSKIKTAQSIPIS